MTQLSLVWLLRLFNLLWCNINKNAQFSIFNWQANFSLFWARSNIYFYLKLSFTNFNQYDFWKSLSQFKMQYRTTLDTKYSHKLHAHLKGKKQPLQIGLHTFANHATLSVNYSCMHYKSMRVKSISDNVLFHLRILHFSSRCRDTYRWGRGEELLWPPKVKISFKYVLYNSDSFTHSKGKKEG